MKAGSAKVGDVCLSPKGSLLTIAGFRNRKVVVLVHETGTDVLVPRSYPLRKAPAFPESPQQSTCSLIDESEVRAKEKVPPLSRYIDPLLLDGTQTMREIVEDLKAELGSRVEGKDLAANVRARVFHLKRRGVITKWR